jgi:hypothetical protein
MDEEAENPFLLYPGDPRKCVSVRWKDGFKNVPFIPVERDDVRRESGTSDNIALVVLVRLGCHFLTLIPYIYTSINRSTTHHASGKELRESAQGNGFESRQ